MEIEYKYYLIFDFFFFLILDFVKKKMSNESKVDYFKLNFNLIL